MFYQNSQSHKWGIELKGQPNLAVAPYTPIARFEEPGYWVLELYGKCSIRKLYCELLEASYLTTNMQLWMNVKELRTISSLKPVEYSGCSSQRQSAVAAEVHVINPKSIRQVAYCTST